MRKLATIFYAVIGLIGVLMFMSSCAGGGHVSHRPYKHGWHTRHYYDPRYQIYQSHRVW
ncbi:MAG: hypothetical protein JSS82_06070 [Bacteroidetes bacterium]|nr:hypothetical protein [Bacteroidota bacterium]